MSRFERGILFYIFREALPKYGWDTFGSRLS